MPTAAACSPDSSTATPISSSPATAATSSPPGWPASPTPPAASASRPRQPGRRPTTQLARARPPPAPRRGAGGITTIEIKSGYGLTVADEARCLRVAGELTDETTFLGAHVVPDEFAGRADDYVDAGLRPRCSTAVRAARPVDRRLLRGRCVRRRPVPGGARRRPGRRARAAAARQPARSRAGGAAGGRARLRVGRPLHLPHRRRHRRPRRRATTVATFLPGDRLLAPASPTPTRVACSDAGVTVALATNCNPGSSYTTSIAVLPRPRRPRDGHDDRARRCWSATAGGAQALRRDDIGRLGPAAAPTSCVLDAPAFTDLVYRPGVPLVAATMIAGECVVGTLRSS